MSDTERKHELVINEPDEVKEPKFSNAIRIGMTEGSFEITFGRGTPIDDDQVQIDVVSKVIIPENRAATFLLSLYRAIKEYEKKFGRELFPGEKQKNDKD